MHKTALVVSMVLVFAGCSKKKTEPAEKPAPAGSAETAVEKPAEQRAPEAKTKGGCSYITEAEASEALGQPSKYRSNDGSENCIIDAVEETKPGAVSVDFTVKTGNTGSYDYMAKNNAKPLDGVGDKALIEAAGDTMAQVAIIKGTATLSMTVSGAKAADTARLKAFADKVFSHL